MILFCVSKCFTNVKDSGSSHTLKYVIPALTWQVRQSGQTVDEHRMQRGLTSFVYTRKHLNGCL